VLIEPLNQSCLVFAGKLMFPNAQHTPTGTAQRARHEPVARLVRRQLPSPERRVVPRLRRMAGAAVPETPVHEDRDAQLGENKIRLAEDRLLPAPAADALSAEEPNQSKLRVLVPAPTNPRHHFRPLGLGEGVSHFCFALAAA